MIYPLVLGAGRRLCREGDARQLTLVSTAATATGVLLARYTPARAAGAPPAVSPLA
jgi:hypothetical protein